MSTVAEHLALMECFKLQSPPQHEDFYNEAYLFTQVHWQDLIRMVPQHEMMEARTEIAKRIREQGVKNGEHMIEQWRTELGKAIDGRLTEPPK